MWKWTKNLTIQLEIWEAENPYYICSFLRVSDTVFWLRIPFYAPCVQEIMTLVVNRDILVCLPTSNIVPQRLFGQHTRIIRLPIPDLFLLRIFSLDMRSWSEEHDISQTLFCCFDWRSMILTWHSVLQFGTFVILMVTPNLASLNKTISLKNDQFNIKFKSINHVLNHHNDTSDLSYQWPRSPPWRDHPSKKSLHPCIDKPCRCHPCGDPIGLDVWITPDCTSYCIVCCCLPWAPRLSSSALPSSPRGCGLSLPSAVRAPNNRLRNNFNSSFYQWREEKKKTFSCSFLIKDHRRSLMTTLCLIALVELSQTLSSQLW